MNCEAARVLLVQIGRNSSMDARLRAVAIDHARECRPCGLRLANERMLSAGLGMVADEHLSVEPPETLESAVMAAFHLKISNRTGSKSVAAYRSRLFWFGTAAVAVGVAIFGVVRMEHPPVRQEPVLVSVSPAGAASDWNEEFISIPYAEPLEPYERTELQRVRLTREALFAMGLFGPAIGMEALTPDPEESLDAEIVVGENGIPRAVRLLN